MLASAVVACSALAWSGPRARVVYDDAGVPKIGVTTQQADGEETLLRPFFVNPRTDNMGLYNESNVVATVSGGKATEPLRSYSSPPPLISSPPPSIFPPGGGGGGARQPHRDLHA